VAKRVSVDKWLFGVTLVLVFLGLVMVFSASAVMASQRFGSAYAFLLRQLAWAVVGFAAMVATMNIDYRRYKHPAFVFTLLGITTALLVAVFFLDRSHHTHRWIRVSIFSFQPSEMAKPAVILFLGWFLETRARTLDNFRSTLGPALALPVLFAALVVMEPDLGTAVICMVIAGAVLWVAGLRFRYFGYALAATVPIFYWFVIRVPWRYDRVLAFLNPYADPQGRGFHMMQSLIAVSTGGVGGVGLMEGKQKLFYLPEPHTDFIFAVIGEELGLLGSLVVVLLFSFFLYRGLRAALLTRDLFGRFVAVGVTAMIAVQAFFNISVVIGLMPTKGIPLPFISYGGTSLLVSLICVGVLLNITQHTD
jgi:cell division protein FtsW